MDEDKKKKVMTVVAVVGLLAGGGLLAMNFLTTPTPKRAIDDQAQQGVDQTVAAMQKAEESTAPEPEAEKAAEEAAVQGTGGETFKGRRVVKPN